MGLVHSDPLVGHGFAEADLPKGQFLHRETQEGDNVNDIYIYIYTHHKCNSMCTPFCVYLRKLTLNRLTANKCLILMYSLYLLTL